MTIVLAVPASLDEHTFEQVLDQLAAAPADAKLLVDARHTKWSSPYGLASLLCLAQSRAERPGFTLPEESDTLSYWARAGFFRHAEQLFELHGHVPRGRQGESNVLLDLTPITGSADVHEVVGRIQQKAAQILTQELGLDPKATVGFAMTLSEVCQNIVEHAGRGGWVMVQTYKWARRLGRRVVQIAVCDAGLGFRQSLESLPGRIVDDRWDDAAALEEAVIKGVSRHRDRGRGQGLAGARRYVGRWDGKLSVRSGTARIAIVPSWDDDPPLAEKLAPFAGSQVLVTIPERLPPRDEP
ncbi:MAG: sensor histidine kinase [Gemmatimonadaceae bacterium]|nr:sensor histidine kinase [Gemmatimonadaceae bacterium]